MGEQIRSALSAPSAPPSSPFPFLKSRTKTASALQQGHYQKLEPWNTESLPNELQLSPDATM
jgi:hypothetical protein